jgi:hypothetical protein
MNEPDALDYKEQTSMAFKTIVLCPSFVQHQVLNQSILGDRYYRRALTEVIKQEKNVVMILFWDGGVVWNRTVSPTFRRKLLPPFSG